MAVTTYCSQTTCPVMGTGSDPVQVCTAGSGTSECTTSGYSCKPYDTLMGYSTCQP